MNCDDSLNLSTNEKKESKIRMESALTEEVKNSINVYELGMKREWSEMEKRYKWKKDGRRGWVPVL